MIERSRQRRQRSARSIADYKAGPGDNGPYATKLETELIGKRGDPLIAFACRREAQLVIVAPGQ